MARRDDDRRAVIRCRPAGGGRKISWIIVGAAATTLPLWVLALSSIAPPLVLMCPVLLLGVVVWLVIRQSVHARARRPSGRAPSNVISLAAERARRARTARAGRAP